MKKYLITGASGFVAYHFFNYLDTIKENCEVLGIDIILPENMKFNKFTNLQIRFIKINLLEYSTLEAVIVSFSPTHIVHLASFSSVAKSWNEPINSFMNNTNILLNLVEIIRKNNISCRLLSIGSSEEYGNVPTNCIPIKESVQLNPISPYAIARVSQEMLAQCYVSSYKMDIILTRSFNHIGPGQSDIFVIPSFIKQILETIKKRNTKDINILTGDVTLIRDFLDVRDVVRAYYLLLENGIKGELYNICSGKGRSIKEIIDLLNNLFKIKINIVIDKDKIRLNDNKIIIGDNTKINALTGWKPEISIMDSLCDIIDYWKEILYLK